MKRLSKKALGLLLVLILCISMVPMPVLATADGIAPDIAADNPADLDAENPAPEPTLQPTPEPEQPTTSPTPDPMPASTQAAELAPQVSQQSEQAPQVIDNPDPVLVQTVDKPLVQVVYHYYDAAQNENVGSFENYIIASTHSYNALAMANGDAISIVANKYPAQVPVSTGPLRFRVLLNGGEDITAQASYDAAMGAVSLPHDFMGHNIAVHWYCPTSEVAELPVTATISIYTNGAFTNSTLDLSLASNSDIIRVPLANAIGLVVSQNGIDLPESAYSMGGGNLNISASSLGGDIAVTAYAPKKVARGISTMGATTQVSHTRSADQIFYGYYTSYYTANGNTAFCLDPTVSGVNAGTYDVSGYLTRGTGYDDLIKAAYYLYGGPAYDSVKNNLFGDPDSMEAYGLCHAAAAYMWLDNPVAFQGLSSTTRDHMLRVIDSVNAQAMPPESFEVFLYNVGSSTNQSLMSWEYTPTGNLEIQKESSDPSKTDKNECYSLEGAKFDVFNGNNENIGSITTDKNGKGKLEGIPAGSGYYLIETKPPKGYAESKTKIPFEIVSGETTTKKIKNIPQNDPIGILLKKLDSDTLSAKAQGSASLEGAQFTIKYYKGHYSTASELNSVSPARSWVVKTDADGFSYLSSTYLVSGDALYFKNDGKTPTLPLGTITIQETKAPEGYLLNDELHIRQIKSQGATESVTTYNAPTVKESIVRGGVSLEKWDYNLNRKAVPQGDASLAGAVLEIYNRTGSDVVVNNKTYKNNAVVHTMTTDATGSATTSDDLLPYGKYEVIEKTAPTGYLNTGVIRQDFEIKKNGVVVSLKTNATAIKNNVKRGGVELSKWDFERDAEKLKQGDAILEGAVLEIWNRSKSIVVVAGKEYAPNEVVHTMTTDANGWAGTASDLLPYGSYEVIEKTPPTGYLNTGVIKQSFQIRENGVIVSMKTNDKVIKNNIVRGGCRIEKNDNEIDKHHAQGGTTFEGAVFELVNRSVDSVLVLDKLYAPGEVVYTFKTDKDGVATTPSDLLPYGTYEVREIEPPEGYLHTGVLSRTFKIREHGKIVDMNTSETAIKNDPIRGDLKGVKISDGDGNRLANVPFRITSKTTGENHVIVTDKNGMFDTSSEWNPHSQDTNRGETDRDGIWFGELWTLDDNNGALLYDDYILEELPCAANEDKELLTFEVSIYRHLTVVDLGTLTNDYTVVPEIFTTAMDKETMAQDAFVSETTTILDTVYYSGLKVGKEYTLKGVLMDKSTGEPLLVDGQTVTAEKTFKALSETGSVPMEFTFDSSVMKGKSVVVFESLEFEGKEIAVHADIEDEGQTVTFREPKIGTQAADVNGAKEFDVRQEVTLVDAIAFENLIIGETYTLKGVLMDKETGEPLLIDGQAVTAEKSFKALKEAGTVEMEFTFSSIALKGKTVVVFEALENRGREIAVHANIEDKNQTVTFREPKIGTSAAGEDGKKELYIRTKVTLVDTVSYENLAVGESYILKGTLMDKETGKPLLVGEKEITAETEFTPETPSGSVTVTFVFDSIALQGKTVVVFESLMCGDKEIAVHADIEDKNQTVTFREPKIGTSAAGVDGKKELDVGSKVTLVDTVSYDNLAVGESYTLKGILMDKEMGAPLLVDGKEVIAEVTFIPETTNGKAEVSFTFNSTALIGKTVVVFESLMCGEKEIAVHADIEDKNQTVTFKEPKIGTSAADQGGSKTVPLAESVTVIDTVTYENLVVGESYLLKGVLMDKATGQPLLIDGKQVTAETLFEAPKSSGSVEVRFTFNSLKLEGKTLVVFESLECAGKEIAVHADINDAAQSVGIGVPPSGGGAKTGRAGLPFVLLLIAIGAGVTGAVVLLRKKNKRNEEVTVNK